MSGSASFSNQQSSTNYSYNYKTGNIGLTGNDAVNLATVLEQGANVAVNTEAQTAVAGEAILGTAFQNFAAYASGNPGQVQQVAVPQTQSSGITTGQPAGSNSIPTTYVYIGLALIGVLLTVLMLKRK